jgi:hypothetical protein
MALPRSITRVDRAGGVTFTSSVERANYTIKELTRAALRDVAKVLRKKIIKKVRTLPGMSKSKLPYKSLGYWVRGKEADLQIGFGNSKKGWSGDVWFAARQELGTKKMKKKGFMRDTIFESIAEIRTIQGQYLSAIEDEQRAARLIDEAEQTSGDGEE